MEDKIRKKRKRRWLILGSIVLLLVIIRLMLPSIVLKYVNKQLAQIPDYRGHVNDIDLHIYRGAYQIKGMELNKLTGKVQEPFFSCETIDLSVEWPALFEGEVVGEILFASPRITFVKGPTQEESQTNIDSSWVDVVKGLIPLRINRLDIQNGSVHYKDNHSNPKVDIYMNNIQATALNLTNSADSSKTLPASVEAKGNTFGKGQFTFHMDLNPLEEPTMFDLNAELKNVNMAELNDFLKAYANFDVSGGTFGLYTELAAKNGQFEGYVKPILKDLEVVEWEKKEEGSVLQKLWETVIAAGTELLENRGKEKEQVATKVPLSGKMDNPQVDIFTAVGTLLKNAFIQALVPSIDQSVNLGSVDGKAGNDKPGLFNGGDDKKGLFDGKDNKKDEKKDKK